ncbi:MAG: cytochrome P450 [Hamadaea sp.]|uniref:cytochrome P450 n=1 Tax=Hamadaea sp. TaxID=2024425 RepID=UPI00184E1DFB|nr:cytochrome P450 [Hamadaea sp.]NUR69260.1 cytochrome P450 [Hamadaea sp.]NUT22397.1 cytochrome P450 [Hamadaea sp.]
MTDGLGVKEDVPGFPMTRTCPFAPPPEYAELRETEPISEVRLTLNGRRAWLLTKYEDVVKVLADPRASSDVTHDGYPLFMPVPVELLKAMPRILFHMDPPEHTATRKLLTPEFTARRVDAMRPSTQEIVDLLIDDMVKQGSTADLVHKLALPLPSYAMCDLLGLPREDREFMHSWISRLVSKEMTPEGHGMLQMEMAMHMDEILDAKEKEPGDDLISRVLARNIENGTNLGRPEIITLIMALVAGGHETTANMISLGTLALLRNPDELAQLKANPSVCRDAVEEMMRLFSVSDFGTSRVALEDIEIGGMTIRAGEGIIASMGAANHDPAVFTDPGTFDIDRSPNRQIGFGYGMHVCSGASLVRMQLEIVFNTLFARLPDLRLAVPFEELEYKEASFIHGVIEMPVTW